ncbi:MAG: CocE/NonD family hydrolase [Pseudomonadales bacterium]|nr:CocE/NonD family hydrolase [Pseudomonadales bacterium]
MFTQNCTRLTTLFILLFGLAACGGNSSDSSNTSTRSAEVSTTPQSQPNAQPAPESSDDELEETPPTPEAAILGGYKRPAEYPKIEVFPMQYIPTTSGHNISVRVTLPADENGDPLEGPFPVILVQSAYNVGMISVLPMPGGVLLGSPDPYMVRRGYAMVAVDVIGGGSSEGGWEMLGAEEQSGYGDVVDWIQQQPWANGDIGVAGASYMAITSLFTAQQRPNDIKAVFASVPMGDSQRGTVGTGGLLNGVFMSHWLVLTQMTSTQNLITALQHSDLKSIIDGATQQHIDQIDDYYLPIIEKTIHGDPEVTYDSEFWRTRSPIEGMDKIQAPTFIMGALNDIFQRDEPLLYELLKDRVDTRLMIFNGDHVGHFLQAFPGTDKTDPIQNIILQWFDKHLKGYDTGTENIPPVTQYVKHHKKGTLRGFATTTDWPHPAAQPERWYLHGDKSLSQQAPFEEEPTNSMEVGEFAEYSYGKNDAGTLLRLHVEPKDGTKCSPSYVQWTLGFAGLFKAPKCHWDNRQLEKNALNYQTEPMAEDYYINGPLQADLWVSSTVTDAVVSVRIDEVTPWGNVNPITNGLLLASMRAVDESRSRYLFGEMIQPYHYFTQDKEQFLEPGVPTKMQVEIFPTSAIIRKGHRLRVSIAPSNQAQGMLNVPRRERAKDGITTIHNSPQFPSSLVVPMVPTSELN